MTTTQRTVVEVLAELGLSLEFLEAVDKEGRRNDEFFAAHCEELWETHKGKWMLIYDGSRVEAFDDHDDLMKRHEALDPIARTAARTEKESDRPWIL